MAGVVLKTFKLLLVIHNTIALFIYNSVVQKSICCFTKKIASAKLFNSAVCTHARESSFQPPTGAPFSFITFSQLKLKFSL